ncbi:hypothetical protein V8C86DRAFT_1062863 [Haematococcus lacustris]
MCCSLFGDAMNTASRMESTCPKPCVVQVSSTTYELLSSVRGAPPTTWTATGGVDVKGKGRMDTWLWDPSTHPEEADADLDVAALNIMTIIQATCAARLSHGCEEEVQPASVVQHQLDSHPVGPSADADGKGDHLTSEERERVTFARPVSLRRSSAIGLGVLERMRSLRRSTTQRNLDVPVVPGSIISPRLVASGELSPHHRKPSKTGSDLAALAAPPSATTRSLTASSSVSLRGSRRGSRRASQIAPAGSAAPHASEHSVVFSSKVSQSGSATPPAVTLGTSMNSHRASSTHNLMVVTAAAVAMLDLSRSGRKAMPGASTANTPSAGLASLLHSAKSDVQQHAAPALTAHRQSSRQSRGDGLQGLATYKASSAPGPEGPSHTSTMAPMHVPQPHEGSLNAPSVKAGIRFAQLPHSSCEGVDAPTPSTVAEQAPGMVVTRVTSGLSGRWPRGGAAHRRPPGRSSTVSNLIHQLALAANAPLTDTVAALSSPRVPELLSDASLI